MKKENKTLWLWARQGHLEKAPPDRLLTVSHLPGVRPLLSWWFAVVLTLLGFVAGYVLVSLFGY